MGLRQVRRPDLLFVPVVDLVNIPENDFVFSFHIFRDSLILDRLHEPLKERRGKNPERIKVMDSKTGNTSQILISIVRLACSGKIK